MNDPMSYQGDSVTLPPYGITHKLQKRLPFGVGIGDVFTGKYLGTTAVKVLSISGNDLLVELTPRGGIGIWRENWNLEHTIVGFRKGIYKKFLSPKEFFCIFSQVVLTFICSLEIPT